MPRGQHPNSLQNLTHEGRPLKYSEPKKVRRLTVTESGWSNAKELIGSMGMSVSQFLEELGRGRISVSCDDGLESIQDALDSALLKKAIAASSDEFVTPDELLSREPSSSDLHE